MKTDKPDKLRKLQERREAAQSDDVRAEIQKMIDHYFLSTEMPGRKRPGKERDDHKRKTKRDREYI